MALRKILAGAVAFSFALSLDQAGACRCASRELCEYIDESAVVVHATALSSSDQADQFEDVIYTLDITQYYKGEPDCSTGHAGEISFVTAGNSAACGVSLVIGEEYLVGLSVNSDGQYTANTCGLARAWNMEDMAILEADGCGDDE